LLIYDRLPVEDELSRALDIGASFIGINNRNLATFESDLSVTEELASKISRTCTIVSESSIRTANDKRCVVAAGVHAVLIGESLMRGDDPRALLEIFLGAAKGAS
jgi:indole-3-glycerol phosphate synthase